MYFSWVSLKGFCTALYITWCQICMTGRRMDSSLPACYYRRTLWARACERVYLAVRLSDVVQLAIWCADWHISWAMQRRPEIRSMIRGAISTLGQLQPKAQKPGRHESVWLDLQDWHERVQRGRCQGIIRQAALKMPEHISQKWHYRTCSPVTHNWDHDVWLL